MGRGPGSGPTHLDTPKHTGKQNLPSATCSGPWGHQPIIEMLYRPSSSASGLTAWCQGLGRVHSDAAADRGDNQSHQDK